MPTYDIAWNRRKLEWRKPQEAPWMVEAILLERTLIEGRPQMRIVCRVAAINEDRTDEISERDYFWHQARRRLGKLQRLHQRDIGAIESLLAKRIPKLPVPVSASPTARPSAHPVCGPHAPLRQALRAR
jgi:hypothetical protein